MKKLFEIEPIKSKATQYRCKNCAFIYKHEYGKMVYCGKQADKSTAYGNKKIKSNDYTCGSFELKTK